MHFAGWIPSGFIRKSGETTTNCITLPTPRQKSRGSFRVGSSTLAGGLCGVGDVSYRENPGNHWETRDFCGLSASFCVPKPLLTAVGGWCTRFRKRRYGIPWFLRRSISQSPSLVVICKHRYAWHPIVFPWVDGESLSFGLIPFKILGPCDLATERVCPSGY